MDELLILNTPSVTGDEVIESLAKALSSKWPQLADKPEENPAAALRALWLAACGRGCSIQKSAEVNLPDLETSGRDKLGMLIERRLSGVPLAHLLGWQQFMGLEFKASPQALIPRKETEILGRAALNCVLEIVRTRGSARVIDVCTGSGNLALSLASHEPKCRVFAADLCPEAVDLAKENAQVHNLQDRVEFRVGDLFAPLDKPEFHAAMDLVVCNPPYLSSSKLRALPREIGEFEPREAFDAGAFGLAIINRLISDAPRFLKPESWLCFEVGLGQGPFFASRLKSSGHYRTIDTAVDSAGEIRALIART
jgi:release factor glutamine methyltransferase